MTTEIVERVAGSARSALGKTEGGEGRLLCTFGANRVISALPKPYRAGEGGGGATWLTNHTS